MWWATLENEALQSTHRAPEQGNGKVQTDFQLLLRATRYQFSIYMTTISIMKKSCFIEYFGQISPFEGIPGLGKKNNKSSFTFLQVHHFPNYFYWSCFTVSAN